jgi:SAM-dependent methyltransferase
MQARILQEWTAGFFRAAPFSAGMHILDIGCGLGDVSFLAGDIVGPNGSVLGIDRDASIIAKASVRALERGCSAWIRFHQADADQFQGEQLFDAAVGRYVLHHQQDPIPLLRHVASQVRPGGLLLFHEFDFATVISMQPATPPLWRRELEMLAEYYRRSGLYPDFGLRLTRAFLDAGLPWPVVRAEVPIGGEPGSYLYGWVAQTVRSLLPGLIESGLATEAELEIDTLAARLEAEAVSIGCQLIGPIQYGAWVRKP